jgi:hypothetical protein
LPTGSVATIAACVTEGSATHSSRPKARIHEAAQPHLGLRVEQIHLPAQSIGIGDVVRARPR